MLTRAYRLLAEGEEGSHLAKAVCMIDRYFLVVMQEYSRDERGRSQLAMHACKYAICRIVIMIIFYMHDSAYS